MDIEAFAKEWIYELVNDMGCVKTAYQNKDYSWEKRVEFEIELRAWEERYRKVSQLCHKIGGEMLILFEKHFPDGVHTYKKQK